MSGPSRARKKKAEMGIPRSPGLHSLPLRLSEGRRVPGTTKPVGGCTRTWRRYPRNRRISQASLDRLKTWQGTKRRSASDLLLFPRRATNLVDYAIRQGAQVPRLLPIDSAKSCHKVEMPVSAQNRKSVLAAECSDPDIVGRNRSSSLLEFRAKRGVIDGRLLIHVKDAVVRKRIH